MGWMSIIEANQRLPTQNSDCVLFSASAATFHLTPLLRNIFFKEYHVLILLEQQSLFGENLIRSTYIYLKREFPEMNFLFEGPKNLISTLLMSADGFKFFWLLFREKSK